MKLKRRIVIPIVSLLIFLILAIGATSAVLRVANPRAFADFWNNPTGVVSSNSMVVSEQQDKEGKY